MNWTAVLTSMLPQHVLLAGMLALLLQDIAAGRERSGFAISVVTVVAATLAALWLTIAGATVTPFPGHYTVSPQSALAQTVLLALTVPVLLVSRDDFAGSRYYVLVLGSLYGASLLPGADSFATLFLGIELMSLPVYVLVLIAFQRPESIEAALKYLVLGGAATATLLMGVSLLYGWSASIGLQAFAAALGSGEAAALAGAVLVLAALFLKAAIVPFHTWAPDAYEGASLPVTAYMTTIVKAGVLLAALRLFAAAQPTRPFTDLLAILPLVSMVWGNLAAIRQTSFRRMIAYSSIAHAGYLYYAFLGSAAGRYESVVFYLVAYGLMNLLAFAAVPRGADDRVQDRLEQFKGLFHRQPFAAVMIAIAMLSLAGIPPLPGFIAKFLVFSNVLAAGHTVYAVLGLVASYLGIYFYLRVIQYMFMSDEVEATQRGLPRRCALIACMLCLLPAVLMSVLPGWLLERL